MYHTLHLLHFFHRLVLPHVNWYSKKWKLTDISWCKRRQLSMGDDNCCIYLIGIGIGGVALLLVILLPMSFQGLEYYEVDTVCPSVGVCVSVRPSVCLIRLGIGGMALLLVILLAVSFQGLEYYEVYMSVRLSVCVFAELQIRCVKAVFARSFLDHKPKGQVTDKF